MSLSFFTLPTTFDRFPFVFLRCVFAENMFYIFSYYRQNEEQV
jgi:hypothetical protein